MGSSLHLFRGMPRCRGSAAVHGPVSDLPASMLMAGSGEIGIGGGGVGGDAMVIHTMTQSQSMLPHLGQWSW